MARMLLHRHCLEAIRSAGPLAASGRLVAGHAPCICDRHGNGQLHADSSTRMHGAGQLARGDDRQCMSRRTLLAAA